MTAALWVTVAVLTTVAASQFVVLPWLRLELRRRAGRKHRPEPEEIWIQDSGLLYIEAADATGVELMTLDQKSKRLYQWKESWPEWERRLRVRTVWYTGRRRALG